MLQVDWTTLGTGIAGVIGGIVAWFKGRQIGHVRAARSDAEVADYRADAQLSQAATVQIKALLDRVQSLESKYSAIWDELQAEKQTTSKLRDRVRQLEGILRDNHISVPTEI